MKNQPLKLPSLVLITFIAIINIRELPLMASVGFVSLFFYAIALLTFLIPSSIAVSYFAKRQPNNNGGVYNWVSQAFNKKAGFVAIWLEWVNNIIGMPATLATVLAIFAFVFWPALMTHSFILFLLLNII